MGDLLTRLQRVLAELSLVRKISMLTVLALTVGVVGYMVHVSKLASMEPLFTNLNSADIGTIVTQLDKQGVQYEVDQEKRTILVPSTEVLTLRMKLASEGLPRFGGVGFELFDKSGFGMSEFEQRVNYQRALEGELARTIRGIGEVESARVHLVLPEKSLFAASKQNASASVILKLGTNQMIADRAVSSITHLVASAVEGLSSDQVTVVDSSGRLLTAAGGDPSVMAGGQAFDQKLQIERSYERRIVELLAPVVGLGKVIARVTADVDFTRTESTDEVVDPTKSAIMNEARTTSSKTETATGSGGVAGAGANQAGGAAGAGGGGTADESTENIQYAVSKSVRRQVTPMGALKRLSVAILVDGKYTEGEEGKQTYNPRPAEELLQLENLVKNAIGFATDRGDTIKVDNLEFQTPTAQIAESETWYQQRTTSGFLVSVIGNVLVVIMGLLVIFFVIRPMLQSWRANRMAPDGTPLLEGQVSADIGQLVRSDPVAAANAIRQWIK